MEWNQQTGTLMERYQQTATLYKSADQRVSVYAAWDNIAQQEVVLKFVELQRPEDYSCIAKEGQNQQYLNQHPYICKVWDHFYLADSGRHYLVLSLEKCDIHLERLWRQQATQLDEAYLWTLLYQCVSALAYAQEFVDSMQGISHRDIKTTNIMLGFDRNVRICDFGSSKYIGLWAPQVSPEQLQLCLLTVQGSKPFASPAQRPLFHRYEVEGVLSRVAHNPFKSDVYSLGITFLVMAMRVSIPMLDDPEQMQQFVNESATSIQYSDDFKRMIYWMTCYSEDARPDFLGLYSYMKPFFEPQSFPSAETSPISAQPASTSEQPSQSASSVAAVHISIPPSIRRKSQSTATCVWYSWHSIESQESDPSVPLPCCPTHTFCKSSCLRSYASLKTQRFHLPISTLQCPECKKPIPAERVYLAYGDKAAFDSVRSAEVSKCDYCHSSKGVKFPYSCEHRMCTDCKTLLKSPNECPICWEKKEKSCEVF